MIVGDFNLIACLHLPGPKSAIADAVFSRDPDWIVPPLWQLEFRSILFAFIHTQGMSTAKAEQHWNDAILQLGANQVEPETPLLLQMGASKKLSAYDAEYACLAIQLALPLVTSDKEILKAAPHCAITPEAFLA